MKIFFKLFFVVAIFSSLSSANAQILELFKNIFRGCQSTSDCIQGHSCIIKQGGGGECKKNTDHVAQLKSVVEPVNALVNENIFNGPPGVEKIIYFDSDSFIIKPEFQSIIEAHAQFLKTNNRAKISIEGHADKDFPSHEYSLSIGNKRAEAILNILMLMGVDESQVQIVSFGREKPAVQGTDQTALAKNRRVEFVYK